MQLLCWIVWCLHVGALFASSSPLKFWLAKSKNIPHWQREMRGSSYRLGAAAVALIGLPECSCEKASPRKRMLPRRRAFEYCRQVQFGSAGGATGMLDLEDPIWAQFLLQMRDRVPWTSHSHP